MTEPRRKSTKVCSIFRGTRFLVTGCDASTTAQVTQLLTEHGGELVRKLVSVSNGAGPVMVVARPAACRTLKYLYSLARGVPPVAVSWVHDSVAAGDMLPRAAYELPAGLLHGTSSPRFIPTSRRTPSPRPLTGTTFAAVGNGVSDEWRFVLQAAGAAVASSPRSAGVTVVVAVGDVDPSVLRAAARRRLPVVTVEHVLETLVRQAPVSVTKPQFQHDPHASRATFRGKVLHVGDTVRLRDGSLVRVLAARGSGGSGGNGDAARVRVQALKVPQAARAGSCDGACGGACRAGVAVTLKERTVSTRDVDDKVLILNTNRQRNMRYGCSPDIFYSDAIPDGDDLEEDLDADDDADVLDDDDDDDKEL